MEQEKLYKDFDFKLLNSTDFKEDAVREELINPILKKLEYKAYGYNRIIYSKNLTHPFVKIGSKKRQVSIIPDYLFEVAGDYFWVLDAKSPSEDILSGDHIEQVYSYAMHPEVDVDIFALCNGRQFVAYHRNKKEAILSFQLSEIDKHWDKISEILSPDAFIRSKIDKSTPRKKTDIEFNYLDCKLPETLEKVRKQATKRHYGVHGYFTKQSWDILQHYIKNFTKPGDLVLDPFGGSGVTAVESLMLDRKAINIDINPLTIFIIDALTIPVDFNLLHEEFEKLLNTFEKNIPRTKKEIKEALKKYPHPNGNPLPKDADVETVRELFSNEQLAQLAYLKFLILKIKNESIRKTLLLAFSSTISLFNLTVHRSKKNPGGPSSGAFTYYRYRIAPSPTKLEIVNVFSHKIKRLFNAKKEIAPVINKNTIKNLQNYKGTATNLSKIKTETIDYIYTDPPYGSHIQYLDLSIMWNSWLDLEVTEEDKKQEAIEGGMQNKTRENYTNLITESIKELYRVLKFDRWMSFVFAHKDPYYWHVIVETAEKIGFEYVGAVKQTNGQTSFKKRKNPFSTLAGQLIVNFIKKKTPRAIQKIKLGDNIYDLIIETIESVIAKNNGASIEEINDELIMKGMELGFLDILSKEYKDLTPILMSEFDYESEDEKFYIRKNTKFKTKIPLDMRIRYFLISYLKRNETQNVYSTTDNIILDIMILLKNGITPDKQTILIVLNSVADEFEKDKWRIKQKGQMEIIF